MRTPHLIFASQYDSYGLYMQGARWDLDAGCIEKSRPKEMFCAMPIINVTAVVRDEMWQPGDRPVQGIYRCPCYKTELRRSEVRGIENFVFTAQLRTESPSERWTLAGVALLLDAV